MGEIANQGHVFAPAEAQELWAVQQGRKDKVEVAWAVRKAEGCNESSWTLVTYWMEIKCWLQSSQMCLPSGKSGTISEAVSPFVKER